MATISCQATRTSGAVAAYASKDPVAISALNASVPLFEQRLREIRMQHGKDGYQARKLLDENGKPVLDANGNAVPMTDSKGNTIYESKYVQAYALVQSFGPDELDPNDPASWEKAQQLARALGEDRFNGHPVLVATEVNGRSGCVHNHIIVGAIHPDTGKSIDSNLVTHSKLALAHDRVLAEQGFNQRDDMVQVAEAAALQMEEAKAAVQAKIDEMPEELRPSQAQQKRMLLAAEKNVKFQGTNELTATQQRDAKRMREYGQYMLNEQSRSAARELGIEPEPERFSEIVLEERIRTTLADPRVQSWEDLSEISREYGLTVKQSARGNDVSYGMMLEQPDGTLRAPARAHTRRGGNKDKGTGLGEGFRVEDVQQVIETNLSMNQSDAFFEDTRNAQALEDLEEQRQADLAEAEANRRRIEFAVANPQMLAHMEQYQLVQGQSVAGQGRVERAMIEAYGSTEGLQLAAAARHMPAEDLLAAKEQAAELYGENWREMSPEDVRALRFQKAMDEGKAETSSRIQRQRQDAEARRARIDQVAEEQKVKYGEPVSALSEQSQTDVDVSAHESQGHQPDMQQVAGSTPAVAAAPEREPWRSGLRGIEAKSGAQKVQARIDGLVALEEQYKSRGMVPDAKFEQQIVELGGVNRQFLHHYGVHLDPQMFEQLDKRVAKTEMARGHVEAHKALKEAYGNRRDELMASREVALDGDPVLRDLRRQSSEHAEGVTILRDEIRSGDYTNYGPAHRAEQRQALRDQRLAESKAKVFARAAAIEQDDAQKELSPHEQAFNEARAAQERRSRGGYER